jgi:hypothetical protein
MHKQLLIGYEIRLYASKSLNFLWVMKFIVTVKDGDKEQELISYIMTIHLYHMTGTSCLQMKRVHATLEEKSKYSIQYFIWNFGSK